MVSDVFLSSLSNSLGVLAVILIVVHQFVTISARRAEEARGSGDDTETSPEALKL